MATQAQIFAAHLVPAFLLWLAAVFRWIPIERLVGANVEHLVFYAPVYAVFALGVYAVCTVLYGVATFNDCPEARDELRRQIDEAKEDLRRRRVID